MNFTITNRAILVRILQLSRLAVSGSENQERPKCKNNELGFLYNINDPLLRSDTNFQHNRLKTEGGVPRTKRTNDRTGISLKIMNFRSANWSMREILGVATRLFEDVCSVTPLCSFERAQASSGT